MGSTLGRDYIILEGFGSLPAELGYFPVNSPLQLLTAVATVQVVDDSKRPLHLQHVCHYCRGLGVLFLTLVTPFAKCIWRLVILYFV